MSKKSYYKVITSKHEKKPTFNLEDNFYWLESMAIANELDGKGRCRQLLFKRQDIINGLVQGRVDKEKYKILRIIIKDMGKGDKYIAYACY